MTQVDGPTLMQMRREDAIDELRLSEEQAAAMVDELGLLLGLDALDFEGEGTFSKREIIDGIGGIPDVAALFGLALCDSNRLHELFPDIHDVLSRAQWLPLVRFARAAEQQREAERQRRDAETAAIEAAKSAAEAAAARMQTKLKGEMEARLNEEHAQFELLQRKLAELQRQEAAHLSEVEVRRVASSDRCSVSMFDDGVSHGKPPGCTLWVLVCWRLCRLGGGSRLQMQKH